MTFTKLTNTILPELNFTRIKLKRIKQVQWALCRFKIYRVKHTVSLFSLTTF